ncbi:hypothetical protein [Sphingomonas sp. MMS24-J13]|uniref:hypothetical protein n=1 Tax=Sphingomonas sp. MMS24-J13 TaxID=3238686 RepID=UPI00384D63ED
MSRLDDAPELAAEIEGPSLRPFLALHVDLPDPVYAFTGKGTLTFEGHDWTGIEGVATIGTIGEDTDGTATGVTATLNRIPTEFRDDVADQAVRGGLTEFILGCLSGDYKTLIGRRRLWKGRLQQYDINDSGTELSVTITAESRAIDQRRPAIKRFTDEYQQRKYPGDKVFEYVPRMVEVPILWANASQDATSTSTPAGNGRGRYSVQRDYQ